MDPRTHTAPHGEEKESSRSRPLTGRHPPKGRSGVRASRRARLAGRLAVTVRGLAFGGIAYLFGSCSLPFGTAPLGIALLAASASVPGARDAEAGGSYPAARPGTAYTWYILAGLAASALTRPVTLPPLGWIGIYAFCVLLRLAVLLFIDPPRLPGETVTPGLRGAFRYAGRYLRLCLRSAGANLGWRGLFGRASDDASGDYYAGAYDRSEPGRRPVGSGGAAGDEADESPFDAPPADARLFCEHPFLRILTGALTGFAAGAFALVRGGFAVYDLFGTLFQIAAVPLCVLLLCPLFTDAGETLLFDPHPLSVEPGGADDDVRPSLRALVGRFRLLPLCAAALLVPGIVYAARTVPLPEAPGAGMVWVILRPATLLGLLLMLSASARLGLWPGLCVSLLAGAADSRVLLPAYLVTAAVYALLRVMSHRAGVIGGCLAGAVCASFGSGSVLTAGLPAFLLAIPCRLVLERLGERLPGLSAQGALRADDFALAVTGQARADAQRARIEALSGALAALSAEVSASGYADMAALLSELAAEDEAEYRVNAEEAGRICEDLLASGLRVTGVVVCGRRSRRVVVRGDFPGGASLPADAIRARIERLCGGSLSGPEIEEGRGGVLMVFTSEASLAASYAGSTVPAGHKAGDELPSSLTSDAGADAYLPPPVCGDHIAVFRSDAACLYALISDGMGSGEAASEVSALCSVYLERLLSAGSRMELSLRMLNSFLRARNGSEGREVSATIDLLELDLTNGHAVFAKNGASPTYVVRAGTVYKLRARSLPLGILRDCAPRILRFRMHPGDVVVMVSDGVTLGNDECPWLIDLLSDPLPDSMDALRLDILRRALDSGSPDDLSAIAIKVEDETRGESS